MWNLTSRIHRLNHFPPHSYVKRDDELSCTISGSKLRKYASLMPALLQQNIQHLIIIAGPQSNNLLAAVQLAREHEMKMTAFLIKPWREELTGNYKFTRLFLEEEDIVWIEREEWSNVETQAQAFSTGLKDKSYILHEGASVPEAMEGAKLLGEDILRNEKESGIRFNHLFIDAGTGFSAIALIQSLYERQHPAMIHVLLLADNESVFKQKLLHWIGVLPENVNVFLPSTAKAFGSVNQSIKAEIRRMAKEEGFLVDPVYSAKLFYESRKIIHHKNLEGNKLIIHSGGLLSLTGFDF